MDHTKSKNIENTKDSCSALDKVWTSDFIEYNQ